MRERGGEVVGERQGEPILPTPLGPEMVTTRAPSGRKQVCPRSRSARDQ